MTSTVPPGRGALWIANPDPLVTAESDYVLKDFHFVDGESLPEKIQASVLAINFADDELNPPELGIVDRAKQRIRSGQFVLIPASSQTQSHMTLRKAFIYAPF